MCVHCHAGLRLHWDSEVTDRLRPSGSPRSWEGWWREKERPAKATRRLCKALGDQEEEWPGLGDWEGLSEEVVCSFQQSVTVLGTRVQQ